MWFLRQKLVQRSLFQIFIYEGYIYISKEKLQSHFGSDEMFASHLFSLI